MESNEILLNSSNDIYTVTFNPTSKVIILAGINNFPLDFFSIKSVYDATAAANVSPLSNINQFAWFRSKGLPIFVYGYSKLPSGAAGSDTLNIMLSIPRNQSLLSLQQKQASASAGSPGTLVSGETPTGTIDGTNKDFTLANSPVVGAVTIFYVPPGGNPSYFLNYGIDFTVNGNAVTLNTAPVTSSSLYAIYYH